MNKDRIKQADIAVGGSAATTAVVEKVDEMVSDNPENNTISKVTEN